jgi:hypothetical protein
MDTETKNKTSAGKVIFITLIIIISVFLIYYSYLCMLSPLRKLAEIKNEFVLKPASNTSADERMFSDSLYLKLLKEKAYLQSKIAMAETDSIYLTIDLADSSANVEISGVVVHKAKIKEASMSKIFTKGNENTILSMISTPFVISNSFATIKREPVMIKMAPKDTSEYKPSIMPDTSITEPVNYILELTDGTRLYVYQEEKDKSGDRMSALKFDLNNRLSDTWRSLKSAFLFKVPEYHPFIKIKLPRADAKIIYRALPRKGQIAVFW